MKNDIRVMHALLNDPRALDVLPITALHIIYDNENVHSSEEIQDMIKSALEKKDPDGHLWCNEIKSIM